MGLFDRLRRVVRSRRGGGETADHERLDRAYREQAALVQQVRRALADLSTNRRRVELQLTTMRHKMTDLDEQAKAGVAAGDDAAARAALTRRQQIDKGMSDLADTHAKLVADEAKLQSTADRLNAQIENFRARGQTLSARQSAAEARAELHRATREVDEEGTSLRELEHHTRQAEATADAYEELLTAGEDPMSPDAWDAAFEQGGEAGGPHQISQ